MVLINQKAWRYARFVHAMDIDPIAPGASTQFSTIESPSLKMEELPAQDSVVDGPNKSESMEMKRRPLQPLVMPFPGKNSSPDVSNQESPKLLINSIPKPFKAEPMAMEELPASS